MFKCPPRFYSGAALVSNAAARILDRCYCGSGLDVLIELHETLASGDMRAELLADRIESVMNGWPVMSEFVLERQSTSKSEPELFVLVTNAKRTKTKILLDSEIEADDDWFASLCKLFIED